MKTIGIISDTHGLIRPEALRALEGCSLILHAGDVGAPEVLEALGRIAPVCAVFGNTDYGELRKSLPTTRVMDLRAEDGEPRTSADPGNAAPETTLAYLLHDLDQLDLDPEAAGFALVATGHTHRPRIQKRGGVVYLNPGSAGPRRLDLPVTVARVVLGDGGLDAEIVELVR